MIVGLWLFVRVYIHLQCSLLRRLLGDVPIVVCGCFRDNMNVVIQLFAPAILCGDSSIRYKIYILYDSNNKCRFLLIKLIIIIEINSK